MLKKINIIILAIIFSICLSSAALAAIAQDGDKFERCSKEGVGTGVVFLPTAADTVTMTISNLDPNLIYYGVDTVIFHKTSATNWTNMFLVDRKLENKTTVNVTSFGAMSSYNYDDIYILSYRILTRQQKKK